MKICIVCGSDSKVRDPKKDWFSGPTCSSCYKKARYRKNPKEDIEKRRKRRLAHLEEERADGRARYQKDIEKIKIYRKARYLENKEAILIKHKKYRQTHREQITKYTNERRSTDLGFKLRMNLRNRLRKAVLDNYKAGSAVSDLGCSIEEFKVHLESKFQLGMTWDNYGRKEGIKCWTIDHIIPLIRFDLTDRYQLLKACHYTNMQPLWAEDNSSKKDK